MAIPGIRADAPGVALLPVHRGGASSFADSFRSQMRAQVVQAIAAQLGGAQQNALNGVRADALQHSLVYRSGQTGQNAAAPALVSSGQWADLARGIGGHYLSPRMADVFTRQMALESGNFDPDVIAGRKHSAAGAEGIAQLMPASYPNVNRTDPVASLNAAASTMRQNLQTYGGDQRQALAAYNAGTATVSSLVARLGARWETGLPAETQHYLRILVGPAQA